MLKCWYIFREYFLNVIREVDIFDLDTTSHEISSITLHIFRVFESLLEWLVRGHMREFSHHFGVRAVKPIFESLSMSEFSLV